MIKNIEVNYSDRKENIKKYSKDWISSVYLSKHGADTLALRHNCENSSRYHAICFNISGTNKYWFRKDTLAELLRVSGTSVRNVPKDFFAKCESK